MQTFGTEHLSMNELSDGFRAAKAGDALVYATGDLAFSRYHAAKVNDNELGAMAGMVWNFHERSEACLSQRRVKTGFQYIATKRAQRAR